MTNSRRVWVLGATSAIAQAYARRRASQSATLILLGRNEAHLRANAADLMAHGATAAVVECCDLAHPPDYDAAVTSLMASEGLPDEVVLAYGTLEQQGRAVGDLAYARELIETNFTSAACWLLAIIARWDRSRPLRLIVIGSVAGDRGRGLNFVYGSAKGGLDRFAEGLQHAYAGTALRVVRVKPGFVDTPMTAHMAKGGLLWATPDRVAADIARAADRGQAVVYTPWFWWLIMMIIRHLPRLVFHRLKI
jgi:decaprenylphospho-beta-D-erythro-pentofuranosid-2-ulose 2-reductase